MCTTNKTIDHHSATQLIRKQLLASFNKSLTMLLNYTRLSAWYSSRDVGLVSQCSTADNDQNATR